MRNDKPLSRKEKHRLQVHQKLDAILRALNHTVESCDGCLDGVRECGLRSDPDYVRCYQCNGSTINIKPNPFSRDL